MDEYVDLLNYEGIYKINRNGDICNKRGLKMKPTQRGDYLTISLCKNKGYKHLTIHKLLALQFIPNPENHPIIDHINRNSLDNRLENLRWTTYKINNQNASINKCNTSGHKNISCSLKKGTDRTYWEIKIECNGNIYRKVLNIAKYTLEDAVEWRNNKKLELGLEII
jgi:ribosomal protein S6